MLATATESRATAQSSTAEPMDERLRRALEAREELDRILEELPPELRAEYERRLAARPDTPPPPEPAAPQPPPASEPEPAPEPAAPEPRCGDLTILDSNGDGALTGLDRNWRYLALWKDDGDGEIDEKEVRSLFRHEIRRLGVRLVSYTTSKDADGAVWTEDRIYFDLPGRASQAVLVIDAGRLARGDELWLEDSTGSRLSGYQPLRAGIYWVFSSGERTPVLCG